MLPGHNQAVNTITAKLAQCRAGSVQKVPQEVAPKLPGDAASKQGNWKTQEGGLGNTVDCKQREDSQVWLIASGLGVPHCHQEIPFTPTGGGLQQQKSREAPSGWKPPLPERPGVNRQRKT